jgi:hypothetical protein
MRPDLAVMNARHRKHETITVLSGAGGLYLFRFEIGMVRVRRVRPEVLPTPLRLDSRRLLDGQTFRLNLRPLLPEPLFVRAPFFEAQSPSQLRMSLMVDPAAPIAERPACEMLIDINDVPTGVASCAVRREAMKPPVRNDSRWRIHPGGIHFRRHLRAPYLSCGGGSIHGLVRRIPASPPVKNSFAVPSTCKSTQGVDKQNLTLNGGVFLSSLYGF